MKFKTLEELVRKRRGYKYPNKDWTSPFVVEYSIPNESTIITPSNSDGKFRTNIIHKEKVHKTEDIFPQLKGIQKRLKNYKPINPITAEKLPPKKKIKEIMAQVGGQVGAQVGAQLGAQLGAQVGAQVGAHLGVQVGAQVGNQVWAQVWAQVGNQVWAKVGAQVGDQVWAQVGITTYYAVKEFLRLDCDHPVFGLTRLGVFVVNIEKKIEVFGKNGKYLGEFDEQH